MDLHIHFRFYVNAKKGENCNGETTSVSHLLIARNCFVTPCYIFILELRALFSQADDIQFNLLTLILENLKILPEDFRDSELFFLLRLCLSKFFNLKYVFGIFI